MISKRVIIIRNAAPEDFGGGERFPVFLATALKGLGWAPIVMSRSEMLMKFAIQSDIAFQLGPWWSRQNWSGWRITLVPVYFLWQVVLSIYYLVLFALHKPSVVHIQSKDDFIAGTIAAKLLGIRVIWTDHADLKHIWENLGVWYKNPVGKLVYLAAKSTSSITVVSHSEEALVKHRLGSGSRIRDKIKAIYNGTFDQASQYPRLNSSDNINIVIASRLVFDKGIREAIEAFVKLKKELKNVELTIMGDGPDNSKIKMLPGSENVTFLGYVSNPIEVLAKADVFLHPTYHEGFSVALVEASMMSLPIIATNVGGNPEIIQDQKTGLLVPSKDSDALYIAMKTLADSKTLRSQYGAAARKQFLEKFEFTQIVKDKFLPLYKGDI